jgi:hypothetical protein
MKRLLLVPVLLIITMSATWAHPPGPPLHKPDLSALYQQWQFTEEQIAELDASFAQHIEAVRQRHEQGFQSRQERREAMKALQEEHQQQLSAFLTAEQVEELHTFMLENRPRRHHRMPRRDCAKNAASSDQG